MRVMHCRNIHIYFKDARIMHMRNDIEDKSIILGNTLICFQASMA